MLELKEVEKKYGKKTAVEKISLRLDKGIYGLLGPNGSGKTTLMRCITGILRPTGGQIIKPELTGYLPQKFGMYKELTLYEAMEYFAVLKGVEKAGRRQAVMECLESAHLEDRAKDRMRSLSGGMVRRAGIAQALLGNPELVLLDEPTAGLDPEERLRFKNLLTELEGERTILISTHIVEDVESGCDHILVLHEGKLLAQGTTEEIRQNAAGKVYLVPQENQGKLSGSRVLLRKENVDGEKYLRVLSEEEQPGKKVRPTVEDGYMSYIHGMG